jgi:hypothetical protein
MSMTCTASWPASVRRRRREGGAREGLRPHSRKGTYRASSNLKNLNCIGSGEDAPPRPPRVHTSTRPAPVDAHAAGSGVLGRSNTLRVLSFQLEVASRPRVGQTAKPSLSQPQIHKGS